MRLIDKKYISLIIWVISLIIIGSVIGTLTKSNINSWYMTLKRSPLSPPNYLFGIVWSILYAMIATSGWLIWRAPNFPKLNEVKKLYIFQLLLNWLWTPMFFSYHLVGTALICLFSIIILVILIIFKSHQNISSISILLTPYLLWLIFALHLNFYIWQHN